MDRCKPCQHRRLLLDCPHSCIKLSRHRTSLTGCMSLSQLEYKEGFFRQRSKSATTPTSKALHKFGGQFVPMLRDLRNKQSAMAISRYVFTQENSFDPMHPQTPTRYFKKFGQRYGIKDFHPHKLRHTSASIAITHGADVVSVSERLGHSDTSVTLRMYAHANEESIRRAGQIARDALKQKQA